MVVVALKIKSEDWPEFVRLFLITHPNQTKRNYVPLTDEEWVKHRILLFALGSYEKGFRQEFEQLNFPKFESDIVTL